MAWLKGWRARRQLNWLPMSRPSRICSVQSIVESTIKFKVGTSFCNCCPSLKDYSYLARYAGCGGDGSTGHAGPSLAWKRLKIMGRIVREFFTAPKQMAQLEQNSSGFKQSSRALLARCGFRAVDSSSCTA